MSALSGVEAMHSGLLGCGFHPRRNEPRQSLRAASAMGAREGAALRDCHGSFRERGVNPQHKETSMHHFDALARALELIATLQPLIARIARRDRALAQQMRDASNLIAANLAEGRRRLGRDRQHLWSVASGSAAETDVDLRLAVAIGHVTEAEAAHA